MPPFLTILLLVLAGFCLFASAYFVAFYFMMSHKNHDRLAFAITAFFGAAFSFSIATLMRAPDAEAFRHGLVFYLGAFMPTFIATVWFTAFYTGYKPKVFLGAMTVLGVFFEAVHFTRPFGLMTNGLKDFSLLSFAWGETFPYVYLVPSWWLAPWYLYLYVGLGYCSYAGWKHVRESGGKEGKGFLACILLSFAVGFNNMLADLGYQPGFYISELAIAGFIVFMTFDLAGEWRRQEDFFTEVFDAQNDALFVHDAETGAITRVNETVLRLYRAQRSDFLNSGLQPILDQDSGYNVEAAKAYIAKAVKEGHQVFEWHALRKDQTKFWAEVSLHAAILGGRKYVIAVVRDISEKRAVEEALREGEKRFSNIVQASPVGMQFFHLEPKGVLVFKGANPAADRILKMEHQSRVGKTMEEAFPLLQGGEYAEHYRHTAQTGEPWHKEITDTQEGRAPNVYEIFVAQTEPGSVVAMYLDVTERRKMEQDRLRVEIRMQEAQRLESLGMMAGGVAHDFNNILMAVKGNVEMLEKNRRGLGEVELFADIGTSIQHAADLCHQLLAYAGRSRLTPEALDLRQVVRETNKVVGVGASKKAAWDFHFPDELPLVQGDATQIRQVVLNLMMNAVESLGESGGHVILTLHSEKVETPIEGLKPGSYVCLEVADTGCGMSDETKARIFEPFFTTKFTGRGLGLAAVQGILRAHNGSISVQSRLGEGTTMKVFLPALTGKATAATSTTSGPVARFCGRALLVDDEADVRRVTRRMLERLGIEVEEATDGKNGLEIFQENGDSFVGVLLDFTMPEMDGLETYRRLLAIRPGLPALLVSGYGMDEMRDRLKEYPGMALVQKPFGQKELSKALTGIGWPLAALPSDSMESKRFEEMYLSMLEIWVAESRDAESFYGGLGPLWSQIPGIRFSWAGSLDASSERVFPVAESTTPISPTVRDYFMADDSAWSQGPAGLAVHTGVFSIHNGLEQDVTSAPWIENAVRAGFGSLAVLPLKFDGKVDGTWHLYAFEKGYFTEHRMAFLAEAADLLAMGIHKFRKNKPKILKNSLNDVSQK